MSKHKSQFRTQKNGRERGLAISTGAHQETCIMARPTQTKNKRQMKDRLDRKEKNRGWAD